MVKDRELIEFIKKECPCIVCEVQPVDAHHVKTRGAGGDDTFQNLMPLCRIHHTGDAKSVHNIGLRLFAHEFPAVKIWLSEHWEFDKTANRWIRKDV